MPGFIDTHSHLNDRRLYRDLDRVLARASAEGVDRVICPGYDMPSSRVAVEIAERFENVWATVGVHPHDAKMVTDEVIAELADMALRPRVVALGEIGLDYYRDLSPRPVQQDVFRRQLQLANSLGLPVVIHDRDAGPDIMRILGEEGPFDYGGVLHCFAEDADFALRVVELGFYIGVDGPVTWNRSERLQDVVRKTPLDRILIETDAPYLTPHPFRGKDNEPAFVRYVAEKVAEIRGVTVDEIARVTSENAERLFKRLS